MAMRLDAKVAVPEGVLIRELEGESVLLNLDTESYFGLDEVGTRMWTVLLEQGTPARALPVLAAEYAVEPGRLQDDLLDFVSKLAGMGLLRVDEG